MSDLVIPDMARKAACDAYDRAVRWPSGECEEMAAVRAAAPLIVADELERLARTYTEQASAVGLSNWGTREKAWLDAADMANRRGAELRGDDRA